MCDDRMHQEECDCYDCVEAKLGRRRGGVRTPDPEACCCEPGDEGFDVAGMWKDAFHEAYHEVQVEIFKAKIKATMGKTMDKVAGLVLESMLEEIRDSQKKTQSQKTSREKMEKLIQDTLKV
ncbi:MAG: hypothetical protein HY924_01465 [Elusimicrobia bacterium]|nr:hypothetical protein [Elusimicrobiota bacterium]